MNSALQNVLSRLKGVKKVSKGHEALCPAHNDTRPSLKVDAVKTVESCLNVGQGVR